MLWALTVLILLFGLAVFRGAPYVNSHKSAVKDGLDLVGLRPGQTLVDLGSGSGSVLKAAAERGIKGIGYELNPILVLISRFKLRNYRELVRVEWGDFWFKKLPKCDAVYVFITANFAGKMAKHIQDNIEKPTKVLSYSYRLPELKEVKQSGGFFLYEAHPVAKQGTKP